MFIQAPRKWVISCACLFAAIFAIAILLDRSEEHKLFAPTFQDRVSELLCVTPVAALAGALCGLILSGLVSFFYRSNDRDRESY